MKRACADDESNRKHSYTKYIEHKGNLACTPIGEDDMEHSSATDDEDCSNHTDKTDGEDSGSANYDSAMSKCSYDCKHKRKKVTALETKEMLYSFQRRDFKRYDKLGVSDYPDCCCVELCREKHKIIPQAIYSLSGGPLYNILDYAMDSWSHDTSAAAFMALRPDQYFRGDILRILFQYILVGPSVSMVMDVRLVLSTHFKLHPPCTDMFRRFYQVLLSERYDAAPELHTELNEEGVLNYMLRKLEEFYKLPKPGAVAEMNLSQETLTEEISFSQLHINPESGTENEVPQNMDFEELEKQYNNFEPVLDDMIAEFMAPLQDAMNEVADSDSSGNDRHESDPPESEDDPDTVKEREILLMNIMALELLVDLVEADFLICVSKRKLYLMEEAEEVTLPLIGHLMDHCDLLFRVLRLYNRTRVKALWMQLSRLIGVMAERVHLFTEPYDTQWKYSNFHEGCAHFLTTFLTAVPKLDKWSEAERLSRLRSLHPPWLRLRVAKHWVGSKLNVNMEKDLKGVVDIIHMHVMLPVQDEMNTEQVEEQSSPVEPPTAAFMKKVTKKNKYGETVLHRLCKNKKDNASEILEVLAVPGVDVNARDNFGWTPLHEAVGSGNVNNAKALLQYKPPPGGKPLDFQAQSESGETPLHDAVDRGNLEMCRLLIEYGGFSLLMKTDNDGKTPMMYVDSDSKDLLIYFEEVIKAQQLENLSPDATLNLPESVIEMLRLMTDAFLTDHHTYEAYRITQFDEDYEKMPKNKWIVISINNLIDFRDNLITFRKLFKVVCTLAVNPVNPTPIRLWGTGYQHDLEEYKERRGLSECKSPGPDS